MSRATPSEVPAFERQFLNLLAEADCLLESHPVFRLQRWVDLAGRAGQSPEERDRFTGNCAGWSLSGRPAS